jgi:hypothetical protein
MPVCRLHIRIDEHPHEHPPSLEEVLRCADWPDTELSRAVSELLEVRSTSHHLPKWMHTMFAPSVQQKAGWYWLSSTHSARC